MLSYSEVDREPKEDERKRESTTNEEENDWRAREGKGTLEITVSVRGCDDVDGSGRGWRRGGRDERRREGRGRGRGSSVVVRHGNKKKRR